MQYCVYRELGEIPKFLTKNNMGIDIFYNIKNNELLGGVQK
jgi:hypothetical protein